jgi:hypothetical protein
MSDQSRIVTRDVLHSLTLDTEPWLSCDDCFDLMDEYVERRVADPAYVDPLMVTHLAACAACAEEADSLYALVRPGWSG